jgi:DNA-binding beta-propeller fold protein YncE
LASVPTRLAYDHGRRQVLVANVGDPAIAGSHTLSVSLDDRAVRAGVAVPGRTRWAVYDPDTLAFYVNIADPAQIVVVDARRPDRIARAYPIPSAGPHGLDLDLGAHRLFCACDSGVLVTLDARSGKVLGENRLSGPPDVVFFDRARECLYVAIGDPGSIDVFDTKTMEALGSVTTEKGAHTFALAPDGNQLYVFLPANHRAAIYQVADSGTRASA